MVASPSSSHQAKSGGGEAPAVRASDPRRRRRRQKVKTASRTTERGRRTFHREEDFTFSIIPSRSRKTRVIIVANLPSSKRIRSAFVISVVFRRLIYPTLPVIDLITSSVGASGNKKWFIMRGCVKRCKISGTKSAKQGSKRSSLNAPGTQSLRLGELHFLIFCLSFSGVIRIGPPV